MDLLRPHRHEAGAGEARRLERRARRGLALARLSRARLVVLMGLPGAGKSTLAQRLAQETGYRRIDHDALRARLFPDARSGRAANAALWRAVHEALARGRGVIVDGMTFARPGDRHRAQVLARRHGTRCLALYLACPRAVARRRIATQGDHAAPDRVPALVDEVARRFVAPVGATRLDARRTAAALLRDSLAAL